MIFRKVLAAVLSAAVFTGAAVAKDNLAILPFTGGVGEEGETIAELFSYNRELNAAFTPIPRTSITRAIRDEQKFQMSAGMTDPDTITAIGKQLGAQYIVTGNIAKLGDRNLLIVSIIKIDDLRQIAGDVQTYAKIEEIQGKLPAMARNIVEATKINATRLDKLAVIPVELGGNVDSQSADALAQILSINLIRSRKYAVYPRTATLEQVQTEYNNQLNGSTADKNIVGIGKGENPRFVLSVVARRLGDRNMFNASIINLESGAQLIGGSVNYQTLNDGIAAMENLARELTGVSTGMIRAIAGTATRRENQSGGVVFGYGALNLALGLGSFIQGDIGGGFFTLLTYGAAAGLLAWDISLDYEHELAGILGGIGFGVAGFAAIYGFIRPVVVNHNRSLAEDRWETGIRSLAERIDRWEIGIVPRKDGRKAIRLTYTMKF
jgi:TolB-like protein